MLQTISGSTNFLLDTSIFWFDFRINQALAPFAGKSGVDGIQSFPPTNNWAIVGAMVYGGTMGSGGNTEFDILFRAQNTGSFVSIFSTRPAITSAAIANVSVYNGDTVTGCTAPILTASTINVSAKSQIRMDLISAQTGSPRNFGVRVFYRGR
jgi:hypothetical protein